MTDLRERPQRQWAEREATDPACPARRHGTNSAWRRHGCRCPEAVAAHAAWLPTRRAYEHTEPRRARQRVAETARRRAGGMDPRSHWRGPESRVDRINLTLLCSGFVDPATTPRERMVAAHRLARTGNRAGTGLLEIPEIAERIGCDTGTVRFYLKGMPERLRAKRTKRRLADVKWRAWHKHGQVR